MNEREEDKLNGALMENLTDKIIISYDGENIKNHQMDIDDFIQSVSGAVDLLKVIADELNLPEDSIQIKIAPLKAGSLEAVIYLLAGGIATYVGTNFADGMGIGETFKQWGREFAGFLGLKRDNKIDSTNLAQKSTEVNTIQGKLLQNKSAHQAVNEIVKCMNNDAETIKVELPDQNISENFVRTNINNLVSNPFVEPLDKADESVQDKNMQLYLEKVGIVGTKWTFYEKISDKKIKRIDADVLDNQLLKDARNSSLEQEYKNVPLFCKVRIKIHKKAGAKKASPAEYYIIECRKDEPLLLFPD